MAPGLKVHGGEGMVARVDCGHGGQSVRLLAHIWVGQEAGLGYRLQG